MNERSFKFSFASVALLILTTATCSATAQAATPNARAAVQTRGRWFVDEHGRTLILHGVNLSASSKGPPFLPWQTKEEVAILRQWGFNHVRYLIVWEAVEPQPGKYDDSYLDKVADRLAWCREAGLKVVLDMHQDLYARRYQGDGAPEWACLDNGIQFKPLPGPWFLNYYDPAVIACFDNFWANRPGPDGVGIQDRFARAWQHVVMRFKDDPNVIGYDILNEPYYGSAISAHNAAVAVALAKEMGKETPARFLQLMQNPAGSLDFGVRVLQELTSKGTLFKMLDGASGPSQDFDRTVVQQFTNRVAQAIRQVDPEKVIVFEGAGGNMSGARFLCGLSSPKDSNGKSYHNTALGPHFYDFSTDFEYPYCGDYGYLREFLGRGTRAADAMNVPTWYGEWGAWSKSQEDEMLLVRHHLDAFDELMISWCYWEYGPGFKDRPFHSLLGRPYAQVIAGEPIKMRCSDAAFELEFRPLPQGGETAIWIPQGMKVNVDKDVRFKLSAKSISQCKRDGVGFLRFDCPPGVESCGVIVNLPKTDE